MRATVLHVVDRGSGGVPVAARTMIANSADFMAHHLMVSDNARASNNWPSEIESITVLPSGAAKAARAIKERADAIAADFIHAHSSFPGVYARLAAGRAPTSAKVIYSPHCFAFERRDIHRVARFTYRLIERALASRTHRLAACSPHEAIQAQTLGISSKRITFIPNATIHPKLQPRPWPVSRPVRIVGVGRLTAQKGPEYFVKAVEALRQDGNEIEAFWLGDGLSDVRATLQSAGIQVSGWLTADAVALALRDSDVYLHTAAWEGFPLSVIEAHYAGLPVVVRPISAFGGLSAHMTVRTEPSGVQLTEEWASRNYESWDNYLDPNTMLSQRAALQRLYGLEEHLE